MNSPKLIECTNVERDQLLELVRTNGYEPLSKVDDKGRKCLLCSKGEETYVIYLNN